MASQIAAVDVAAKPLDRDEVPATKGARPESDRHLTHNKEDFQESGELICERFVSSCCMLTASRLSPVIGNGFQPKFEGLMSRLQDLDIDRSKRVIWAVSRGFQNPYAKIFSQERERAFRHFQEFRDCVAITGRNLQKDNDWFIKRSAFAIAHPGTALVEKKAADYGFDPRDFRSTTYKASKFFRSIEGKRRWSIWSLVVNPPFRGPGELRSRKRVVTAFVDESAKDREFDGVTERPRVDYYSHALDGDKRPMAIKRDFHSRSRDRTVFDIYRASELLFGNSKTKSFDGPILELFRIGFLVLNFEEFIDLE